MAHNYLGFKFRAVMIGVISLSIELAFTVQSIRFLNDAHNAAIFNLILIQSLTDFAPISEVCGS